MSSFPYPPPYPTYKNSDEFFIASCSDGLTHVTTICSVCKYKSLVKSKELAQKATCPVCRNVERPNIFTAPPPPKLKPPLRPVPANLPCPRVPEVPSAGCTLPPDCGPAWWEEYAEPRAALCRCSKCGGCAKIPQSAIPLTRICTFCGKVSTFDECTPEESAQFYARDAIVETARAMAGVHWTLRSLFPSYSSLKAAGHQAWKPGEDLNTALKRYAIERTDPAGRGTCEDCGARGVVLDCASACALEHAVDAVCCVKVTCKDGCLHVCAGCGARNHVFCGRLRGDSFAEKWKCWSCRAQAPLPIKYLGDVRAVCKLRCCFPCFDKPVVRCGAVSPTLTRRVTKP